MSNGWRSGPASAAWRAEVHENFRLAAPLIAAQLSFVGMHTLDTVMAGRLGPQALACVAVGANAWFLAFILFMGLLMAVSTIVAHRVGAGRPAAETGAFLRAVLLLAILLGLVWMVLVQALAAPVLDLLHLGADTRAGAEAYLRAVSWSAIPFSLSFALRNAAEGHGLTRVPVFAGLVALGVNGLANDALMYGRFGLPALGFVGTAWGTVAASCALAGSYLWLYSREPQLRALQLLRRQWPAQQGELWEVARLGLPIAAIVVAEAWLFNIGGLLMGRFGGSVVAAHQIALNIASIAFMVPLSIGLATTVRVGLAAGAGDAAAAALRGRAGIGMGVVFALMSAALMASLPRFLAGLYTQAPDVIDLAARFLRLAALFQIFDCVQATSNGALRGIKDTRLPMAVTVSAYWLIGLPLAAWLALATPVGPPGVWYGFIVALAVAAAGLSARFLRRTSAKRSVLMS